MQSSLSINSIGNSLDTAVELQGACYGSHRTCVNRLKPLRPLSERSKLVDCGLVDFRRVCDQTGILDRENDTTAKETDGGDDGPTVAGEANGDNRFACDAANRCKLVIVH